VHNVVNRSLKKAEFDCSKIGDFYDCGCAKDEESGVGKETGKVSARLATAECTEWRREMSAVRGSSVLTIISIGLPRDQHAGPGAEDRGLRVGLLRWLHASSLG
jgi:hypothetical protein